VLSFITLKENPAIPGGVNFFYSFGWSKQPSLEDIGFTFFQTDGSDGFHKNLDKVLKGMDRFCFSGFGSVFIRSGIGFQRSGFRNLRFRILDSRFSGFGFSCCSFSHKYLSDDALNKLFWIEKYHFV
jgi:hypothetical protein